MVLGRDLGQAINIRPAMARKQDPEREWSNHHLIDSPLFDA
jgi:hypothetical protein